MTLNLQISQNKTVSKNNMDRSMSTTIPGNTWTIHASLQTDWSMADLQEKLGGIPAARIRLFPPPGCATEENVIEIQTCEHRLFELEDGILVEKGMGWYESLIAAFLVAEIHLFLKQHDLGKVLGADGTIQILPGVVKIPDVSFISWNRWPKVPPQRRPIPALVPDLVVEVLRDEHAP